MEKNLVKNSEILFYNFLIFLISFPVKAQITKIDINFASNMPLKAIESPNAKANLIMFIGGPGLKHGKLKKKATLN